MNHMGEVAHMLGLELNEKFRFKSTIGLFPYDLRFTKKKLEMYDSEWKKWNSTTFETLCNLLNGKYEVVKIPKPVLDGVEKEYLSYVIKPFRHRIKYFYKYSCEDGDSEAIVAITKDCDYLDFPRFKKGSMYKGMELTREYSLEELDI